MLWKVAAILLLALCLVAGSPADRASAQGRTGGTATATGGVEGDGDTAAVHAQRYTKGSKSTGGSGSGTRTVFEPCGEPGQVLCAVGGTDAPSGVDVTSVATSVATAVKLPVPTIRFGPEPSANKWNMIPVGYALWVWTEGRDTKASSASKDGLTVSLSAVAGNTVFSMGDGHSLTCGDQPVWMKGNKAKSPCSYTYSMPSPKGKPYTVSATTTWTVQWSAAGQSGTLTMTRTASRTITIGELQSLRER